MLGIVAEAFEIALVKHWRTAATLTCGKLTFDAVALVDTNQITSDLGLLMRGAHAVVTALRTPDSEHVHSLSTGTQLPAGY